MRTSAHSGPLRSTNTQREAVPSDGRRGLESSRPMAATYLFSFAFKGELLSATGEGGIC